MRTLLGFFTSSVTLLAVLLTLIGAVVVLRGTNRKLLRQNEVLVTEMKHMRKANRVSTPLLMSPSSRTSSKL